MCGGDIPAKDENGWELPASQGPFVLADPEDSLDAVAKRSEPVTGLCAPALDARATSEPQDPGALRAEANVFISKTSNKKTPT